MVSKLVVVLSSPVRNVSESVRHSKPSNNAVRHYLHHYFALFVLGHQTLCFSLLDVVFFTPIMQTVHHQQKFLRNYNIKLFLRSARRPQTNGKVERQNQSIGNRLKCNVNSTI